MNLNLLYHTGATNVMGSVYCGFFRASELIPSLCWSTITLSSAQMSITLLQSKQTLFAVVQLSIYFLLAHPHAH